MQESNRTKKGDFDRLIRSMFIGAVVGSVIGDFHYLFHQGNIEELWHHARYMLVNATTLFWLSGIGLAYLLFGGRIGTDKD